MLSIRLQLLDSTIFGLLQFKIALTRYEGGSKGPVVMFHGAGVNSGIFSLDTIDTNLVEYLVQHRYVLCIVS